MSEEAPFVSVVIPVYRDWKRLSICIKALGRQTYPKERYEIVVVDNDPSGVPGEMPDEPNLKYVAEPMVGSYAARNRGVECSKGEIIAFTDSDCIPHQNWVKNAVEFLREHSGVDCVGGFIDVRFSGDKPNTVELYETIYAFQQEKTIASNGFSVTANLFVRKELFEDVGNFDSSLMSGGDVEWSRRCHKAGKRTHFSSEVIVSHPARRSICDLFKKRKRVYYGMSAQGKLIGSGAVELSSLRRLLPPVKAIPQLWAGSGHSPLMSAKVFLLLYALKLYDIWLSIMVVVAPGRAPRS